MADILKISVTFVFIVVLLRKRLGVGYVMLIASALLALLYLMSPVESLKTVSRAMTDPVTIKLAVALSAIRVFELILRENKILAHMMDSSKALLRSKRAVMVSMPLLIGTLPSVGGAYFSAPMVEESTKDLKMPQEEKAFINYWYRHPWEYILPLYPGLVLASAVSGIKTGTLILLNLSYALTIAASGFFLSMKGSPGGFPKSNGISKKGVLSFLPISAVFLLVAAFGVELHYALLLSVAGLLAFYRYGPHRIIKALRHGLSLEVLVLIAGVMLFKEVMTSSGAVGGLSSYFTMKGIPLAPMLFLLPFLTGVLTGLTVGFVSATFPLLLSLGTHAEGISFAFACGFVGVLLSPVHVCLILTKEYFKADLWGIYKKLLPASALVLGVALLQYLVLGRPS